MHGADLRSGVCVFGIRARTAWVAAVRISTNAFAVSSAILACWTESSTGAAITNDATASFILSPTVPSGYDRQLSDSRRGKKRQDTLAGSDCNSGKHANWKKSERSDGHGRLLRN
jgi:hypothetical protein